MGGLGGRPWPPHALMVTPRQLPELAALRERGRSLRGQLRVLEAEESDLEQRFYLGALQLPNRTHPAVVRPPKNAPPNGLWGFGAFLAPSKLPFVPPQPVGDQSQARLLEVVGEKPGEGWGCSGGSWGGFCAGGGDRGEWSLGGRGK